MEGCSSTIGFTVGGVSSVTDSGGVGIDESILIKLGIDSDGIAVCSSGTSGTVGVGGVSVTTGLVTADIGFGVANGSAWFGWVVLLSSGIFCFFKLWTFSKA